MEYFKAAKDAFNKLKVDPQNPAFAEEILDKKLLVRLKKSKYSREKQFFKNVNDLFSSKTYTYPIRSGRQIRQKLEQFYNEIKEKRKGKKMRLQVDHEFQQLKIKDLNKVHNVEMFSILLRGGKAFAAEQKTRELKRRVAPLSVQRKVLKLTPKKIIEISTENMNICPSRKYGIDLERVENKSLNSEKLKTLFNMHRLEKTEKLANRLDRYDDKIYERKRKKLREKLNIGERVYVLAERIKKKMHLESSIKKQYRMLVILIKKQFT